MLFIVFVNSKDNDYWINLLPNWKRVFVFYCAI